MLFFDENAASRSRRLAMLEAGSVFFLIILYIWTVRAGHQSFAFVILSIMLLSHMVRGETLEHLGFRFTNFRSCMEEYSPTVVFVSLLLLSLGILLQTMRGIDFNQGWLGFCSYCIWGLFQQYLLSYFLNRLSPVTHHAGLVVAALFSGAHAPNWFLMPVTLLAGYCCAKAYLKYRNLYFLGLAHGAIGFLLYLVVPDSVSHHLCVGPAWFVH